MQSAQSELIRRKDARRARLSAERARRAYAELRGAARAGAKPDTARTGAGGRGGMYNGTPTQRSPSTSCNWKALAHVQALTHVRGANSCRRHHLVSDIDKHNLMRLETSHALHGTLKHERKVQAKAASA